MKRLIALIVILLFVGTICLPAAYAGWKENYREKYSKKHLSAEEIAKLKHLCDPSVKVVWPEKVEGATTTSKKGAKS